MSQGLQQAGIILEEQLTEGNSCDSDLARASSRRSGSGKESEPCPRPRRTDESSAGGETAGWPLTQAARARRVLSSSWHLWTTLLMD